MSVSREMLIEKVEQNGLDWRSVRSGASPYSPETIVIMDPADTKQLKWSQGLVNSAHTIVCINGPKFDGHIVAVKELPSVHWLRPGFENRGRTVYPIRIFLDRIPEGKQGYTLYREVEDETTLKAARDDGAKVVSVRGEHDYEEFFLVEKDWDPTNRIEID